MQVVQTMKLLQSDEKDRVKYLKNISLRIKSYHSNKSKKILPDNQKTPKK